MEFFEYPHKRYNCLSDEWVLVSPHRTKRPWQGQVEEPQKLDMPEYDPQCYLCPGNTRAGGVETPAYTSTFVFDNDFAALLPDTPDHHMSEKGLLQAHTEGGVCRVICFSPKHNLTLALMNPAEIIPVVDVWCDQYTELARDPRIQYVQIFENRGAMMGCSNPHPHGQIWANFSVPMLPERETQSQAAYQKKNNSCLLCDYVALEQEKKERVVFENDSFIALVPFWAVWPYETLLLPKVHVQSIDMLHSAQKKDLADALNRMAIRFDNIFSCSFPYSMGLHQKPTDSQTHDEWHFHIHYYPPLLRSATVRKFMVGYEMLGMPQRDITAEQSARTLRESSEIHYTRRG